MLSKCALGKLEIVKTYRALARFEGQKTAHAIENPKKQIHNVKTSRALVTRCVSGLGALLVLVMVLALDLRLSKVFE